MDIESFTYIVCNVVAALISLNVLAKNESGMIRFSSPDARMGRC
ncbi:hypothetical protein FDUTEX481_07024 [Tolypothrix sp. PCC 7601]|nr:hypothetical protein FDUTEX481_07024 [Tolypothrix sp. PCC 7601]